MASSKRTIRTLPTDKLGVSFSVKQCRDFQIDPHDTLDWLLHEMGFRRFRLMSYWNEHEKKQGRYDFSALDQQLGQIEKAGGIVTLCLGVRQPRWPESHWPDWALKLPQTERYQALADFITAVVQRYKDRKLIVNWQLENEALNRNFGENGDFNRKRLRDEYNLVKRLDPARPVVMSTSNSWGLPLRRPIPNLIGFSFYRVIYVNGNYTYSKLPVWSFRLRDILAKIILRWPHFTDTFIHELQCEPWGPKAIWEMPVEEQDKSMGSEQIRTNIQLAKSTGLYPMDLWGGEWWYWRLKNHGDDSIWQSVYKNIQKM